MNEFVFAFGDAIALLIASRRPLLVGSVVFVLAATIAMLLGMTTLERYRISLACFDNHPWRDDRRLSKDNASP